MSQRLTHSHFKGVPIESQNLTFTTNDSEITYQLTHYETEDAHLVWLHGYRVQDGLRFYTQRTPDELKPYSIEAILKTLR